MITSQNLRFHLHLYPENSLDISDMLPCHATTFFPYYQPLSHHFIFHIIWRHDPISFRIARSHRLYYTAII